MLKQLFDQYGCDKSSKHQYHMIYEPEFSGKRHEYISILEVGILKGSSTQAWLDFFPNAIIYALDVFTRVPVDKVAVLSNDRVKWIKGDSTNPNITEKIKQNWPGIEFDIIIDDGLHTPMANALTFTNLVSLLKDDGSYYIEDVWPLDIMNEQQLLHPWVVKHRTDYNAQNMSMFLQAISTYQYEVFDNRQKSNYPDSCIYKISKP